MCASDCAGVAGATSASETDGSMNAASNSKGFGFLSRAAMAAQRLGWRPPSPLRRALRNFIDRQADGFAPPVSPLAGHGCNSGTVGTAASPVEEAGPGAVRCLLVTSDLDAGGMDEVVVFLARGLRRHGLHTAVLHASADGSGDGTPRGRLGRALRAAGVEVVELDAARGAAWLTAWAPDVVSAHGPPRWVVNVADRCGTPLVETLHGMHSLFGVDWAAERARVRPVARLVAVSELVRQQYFAGPGALLPDRIVTIPNGVDVERRRLPDRRAARESLGLRDEYLFVCLARHCLQKNTYGLVSAFADVAAAHPDVHLLIAGRPDDRAYFGQVARLRARLPCASRIHLHDHLPEPGAALAAADGFVLDSFFEGWPLAPMEALHAGLPAVISDVGGAQEQIGGDARRGFVVPNPIGDPLAVDWNSIRGARFARQPNRQALVDAMLTLVAERAARAAARPALADEAARRFAAEPCLRRHAEVLRGVLRPVALRA